MRPIHLLGLLALSVALLPAETLTIHEHGMRIRQPELQTLTGFHYATPTAFQIRFELSGRHPGELAPEEKPRTWQASVLFKFLKGDVKTNTAAARLFMDDIMRVDPDPPWLPPTQEGPSPRLALKLATEEGDQPLEPLEVRYRPATIDDKRTCEIRRVYSHEGRVLLVRIFTSDILPEGCEPLAELMEGIHLLPREEPAPDSEPEPEE